MFKWIMGLGVPVAPTLVYTVAPPAYVFALEIGESIILAKYKVLIEAADACSAKAMVPAKNITAAIGKNRYFFI
jgi:hypothetical protein